MTQNEREKEPWPGHDEAIAELQKWADDIVIRGQREHEIIFDDFDSKYHQPKIDSICETLGVPKEHA
jgi:hypothetical protein